MSDDDHAIILDLIIDKHASHFQFLDVLFYIIMEGNHYNFRSRGRKKHTYIHIQLQLVSDNDFVTQSLGSGHPTSRQVSFSDNSGSTV